MDKNVKDALDTLTNYAESFGQDLYGPAAANVLADVKKARKVLKKALKEKKS